MASKPAGRSLQNIIRHSRQTCECSSRYPRSIRQFSASAARKDVEYDHEKVERPRWSYTPERAKAPISWRIKDPAKEWECNSDPARLDNFYVKFLGRGGDKMLTEEVKWLAITHKSFDQGRRGFNDRLSFLGRRILNLQTGLAALSGTAMITKPEPILPSDKRKPFTHSALEGLGNLSHVQLSEVLTKQRLGSLASQLGMRSIIRWKPRNVASMDASGIDVILTTSLYAIIGAIALQKGGDVAAEVAREKILKPLRLS
ncbi:uncharacterized protein LY89DRAFT_645146 [Mollisia scopiformis]|uniref:RNase III domain-containing protein n=1 Tax=Mollisia scopiformis TaxID=149040 RepID=A0A194XBP1_MOLSC|nr:uncharacterized protein LY89DRAFT_645146 [Mollisia scopiformis]KUJ17579.1 hypothetical protein LY89DRAFT_645146 [Mollisia scopiformis]